MTDPIDSEFPFSDRVAILSPHLDDAALSLGGSIARATRSGTSVKIVTVFAYDPSSSGPPGAWDAACGFQSSEEACQVRRNEDARACHVLGASPAWLPFGDVEYDASRDEPEVWSTVAEAVAGVDTVFAPGFPLAPPDHLWLTSLLLRRPLPSARMHFYVEQPYASWRLLSRGGRAGAEELSQRRGVANLFRIAARTRGARRLQQPNLSSDLGELLGSTPHWAAAPIESADRRAKRAAIREYRSQVEGFGPLVIARITLYEAAWGGEGIARVDRVAA